MHRNSIGWFEIYVQDMDRARAFYENTFQRKLEHLDYPDIEMWMFPMQYDAPGAGGALCKMQGKDSGAQGTLIYFSCTDCAVEAARAAENGGSIVQQKKSIGQYGCIAIVLDTEGNLIGLHSMQ